MNLRLSIGRQTWWYDLMFKYARHCCALPCELSQVAAVWDGRGGRDEAEEREATAFTDHPS